MDNFLKKVMDILDTEQEISAETRLDTIEEWDSLSVISLLAMVNVDYGKTMRVSDFKGAVTFQDLYDIIMKK